MPSPEIKAAATSNSADMDFDDKIYDEDEKYEPLAKYYAKEKKINYAGYEIQKSFEKRGGKISVEVNKGGENILLLEYEGMNSYWVRWGLFPFLGGKIKQLVIKEYSGGAHCCTSYKIYTLESEPQLIFDGNEYDMEEIGYSLKPVDINQDGVYEFTQAVMAFDYFHASHAASVFPTAVFSYDKQQGKYKLANRLFQMYLLRGIKEDERKARKAIQLFERKKIIFNDSEYFYPMMEVVLKYIYAGQLQKGWSFFEKNYQVQDKDELREDLRDAFKNDPTYKSIYDTSIK